MKIFKKIVNRLSQEPHVRILRWLLLKLNFDYIFKLKFQKKFKIYDFFVETGEQEKMYKPQFNDLNNLIVNIEKLRPISVLEFGGGYSTIAIAYALSENFNKFKIKGKLYSYDQSKEYLNLTKSIIPKHLEEFIEFRYSELTVDKIDNTEVSLYKDLELKNYELIYEDRYDKHIKHTVCGDILNLMKKINYTPSIIFDGHWRSVLFYERKFSHIYNISKNRVFNRAKFIKK